VAEPAEVAEPAAGEDPDSETGSMTLDEQSKLKADAESDLQAKASERAERMAVLRTRDARRRELRDARRRELLEARSQQDASDTDSDGTAGNCPSSFLARAFPSFAHVLRFRSSQPLLRCLPRAA